VPASSTALHDNWKTSVSPVRQWVEEQLQVVSEEQIKEGEIESALLLDSSSSTRWPMYVNWMKDSNPSGTVLGKNAQGQEFKELD